MSKLKKNLWESHRPFAQFIALYFIGTSVLSLFGYTEFSYAINNAIPTLIIVGLILWSTFVFPLSKALYLFLCVFYAAIMMGVFYRYSQAPIGWWFVDLLDLKRNPYDRFTHFMDGLVPCLLAREIFVRNFPQTYRTWWPVFFGIVCAMALSCYWELVEWGMVVWPTLGLSGAEQQMTPNHLGLQGDVWDTQWDMFSVVLGALTGTILFGKLIDRHALDAQKEYFGGESTGTSKKKK